MQWLFSLAWSESHFFKKKRPYDRSICLTWQVLIKPEKRCSGCKCNHWRLDSLCICRHTSPYLYCMGISLLVWPVDQQRRQLAVSFYSKWYDLLLPSSMRVLKDKTMYKINGLIRNIQLVLKHKYAIINFIAHTKWCGRFANWS